MQRICKNKEYAKNMQKSHPSESRLLAYGIFAHARVIARSTIAARLDAKCVLYPSLSLENYKVYN